MTMTLEQNKKYKVEGLEQSMSICPEAKTLPILFTKQKNNKKIAKVHPVSEWSNSGSRFNTMTV